MKFFALDRYLETARAMAAVSRDQHLGGTDQHSSVWG